MDRFKELTTFVEVAQRGSLSAAAREEGITPAMVGRRVDQLEERLGVKLFKRSTRKVTLTPEGTTFYEDCHRILADLRSAEDALSVGARSASGRLIVTAPTSFGRKHIAPHLADQSCLLADPGHGWSASHEQWANGENSGFVKNYESRAGFDGAYRAMGYQTRVMQPVTYALADQWALCQRWFCSVLGPTWPNRYYSQFASSDGNHSNEMIRDQLLPSDLPDHTAHFAAYAVLGALVLRATAGGRWNGATRRAAVAAWLICAGYGITGTFIGSQFRITSTDSPWAGQGVLERTQ